MRLSIKKNELEELLHDAEMKAAEEEENVNVLTKEKKKLLQSISDLESGYCY